MLDNRVHEHEVQVEKRLDDMEAVLQEYHARADRLQLIPASAKRAEGIQFEIKVNRTGMTANEMVNVDLKVWWGRGWGADGGCTRNCSLVVSNYRWCWREPQ